MEVLDQTKKTKSNDLLPGHKVIRNCEFRTIKENLMSNQSFRKFYQIIAFIVGISMLLAACSSPAPSPAPTVIAEIPTEEPTPRLEPVSQADLVETTWQWVGGREASGANYQVADPENYTLTFSDDGMLFIVADCNTSRSTFELTGNQLVVTIGATTLVACEPTSLSNQFLAQLEQSAIIGTGFGNLVIVLADQVSEMYFQSVTIVTDTVELEPVTQEQIVNILWQWTNLVELEPANEIGVGDPENYDLVLRTDGTYSAKADCNRLAGTYELLGAKLTLNPGLTTLAMCTPESNYDLYMSLLARVTGVGLREGLLVLVLDDNAGSMSYVNAGEAPVATTPQPIEGDPANVLGTPSGVENFDNENNWTTFSTSCFTTEISGGQFAMTANGLAQSACWEFSWPRLDNFYIETTQLMPQSCDPLDRFGLIFRSPDNNRGYLYGFTCSGDYSLTIWDGQATTVLVEPTSNPAILNTPGAVNRMGLLVFDESISLYANGVFLETVTDYTFLEEGRMGYFVRAETENPFTVRYDQLRVWVLEDEFFPPNVAEPLPPVDIPDPAPNVPTGQANVNVNVRTGPSMLFPVLGTAQQGDTGEILGISPDGFWYAVRVPTTTVGTGIAWVSAQFVTFTNPTGQPLPVVTPPLLPTTVTFQAPIATAPQVVMREQATIRSGPAVEFPVFGVSPTGSRAEVIGESENGEWWAVRIPTTLASDGVGWVLKVFTTAINIVRVPVVQTPRLPNNISPAAPASGAPSLITIEPLNVRQGPGNAYPSLGMVARATVLAVVGVSPDREHFIVNIPTSIDPSGVGWVAARFVSAQNVSNVPVIQPPPVP
jgi:heat shock protein HslJ/uncharacterized protein YraI